MKSLSRVQLVATPWNVAHQGPPSMGFSRQEYWSGFPFPIPGDLPDPGIKPGSPVLQADALLSEPPGKLRQKLRQILYVSYQALPSKFSPGGPDSYALLPWSIVMNPTHPPVEAICDIPRKNGIDDCTCKTEIKV